MKKHFVFILMIAAVHTGAAQFRNDNVLYKTVYLQELCKTLQENPGYTILDVRSKGEYEDTSSSTTLNLGHIKGAMNININELPVRWKEISGMKDKPVFVYCTHSQRSRRASKMLADSGFTKIFNINSGLTGVVLLDEAQRECVRQMMETKNLYQLLSPADVCNKLQKNASGIFILDVRRDSAFRHISLNPKFNAYGHLKNAVNIPLADLEGKLNVVPRDKEIIVTDIFGDEAAKAGKLLREKGFEKVWVLMEGMDRLLYSDENNISCKSSVYVSPVKFKVMSSAEYGRYSKTADKYLLLDLRTSEEFNNKFRDAFRNVGYLKNAVNIPAADIEARISEIESFKNSPVVLYAFSGAPEVYKTAELLTAKGFKQVNVLAGGIFNIRWTAANTKGMSHLHDLVTGVPKENY